MMLGLGSDQIIISPNPVADFLATQDPSNNDYLLQQSLPMCSDVVTEPGFVGPIQCNSGSGQVTYTPGAPAAKSSSGAILLIAGVMGALLFFARR